MRCGPWISIYGPRILGFAVIVYTYDRARLFRKLGRKAPRPGWHETNGWSHSSRSCPIGKSSGRGPRLIVLFIFALGDPVGSGELVAVQLEVVVLQGVALAQKRAGIAQLDVPI